MDDFFAQNLLQVKATSDSAEADATLGSLLLRYLRRSFDPETGAWAQRGHDEHITLRRTCHAAEVLHRLNLDADTAAYVRSASNWLINLPTREHQSTEDRNAMRLYPSRFKTLAYLGRFDDEEVQADFRDLLRKEDRGLVHNVGDSSILATCIVLDTLLHLRRQGGVGGAFDEDRYQRIVHTLQAQLRLWRDPSSTGGNGSKSSHNGTHGSHANHGSANGHKSTRSTSNRSQIDNARDLSYVLGLLLEAEPQSQPANLAAIREYLIASIEETIRERNWLRSDISNALYAALQLADHFGREEQVRQVIARLLRELHRLYAGGEVTQRWELLGHALVLRLLLTTYGDQRFTQLLAAVLLRDAEQHAEAAHSLIEAELRDVVRERIAIHLEQTEITEGFTEDRIYHVTFQYWFPGPDGDADQHAGRQLRPSSSMIVKRSTSDAFNLSTSNYNRLPPALRELFVRQPSQAHVHKSQRTPSYFLVMEDLTALQTLRALFNQWDQRAMFDAHIALLHRAAARICEASFRLFEHGQGARARFHSIQLSRLYLAHLEGRLTRGMERVPWLKNPIEGCEINGQRYRSIDYYLNIITRYAQRLQPRFLGLTHGDFHARNIMLDGECTTIKLIDLDKLSWAGDYLADLGTLLENVVVYRRLSEQHDSIRLPSKSVAFEKQPTAREGTVENVFSYPALGRPATKLFQEDLLGHVERFAMRDGAKQDPEWKARLWLATAVSLLMRLAYQTQKAPAAVLYGEGIRLLHELAGYLEHGKPLPPLPFPSSWSEQAPHRSGASVATQTDAPTWCHEHEALRAIHEGLLQLNLRAVSEQGTVRYYASGAGEEPVALLTLGRRDALARLLLAGVTPSSPAATSVEVQRSAKPGERFQTVVLIKPASAPADVLAVASTCLAAVTT